MLQEHDLCKQMGETEPHDVDDDEWGERLQALHREHYQNDELVLS